MGVILLFSGRKNVIFSRHFSHTACPFVIFRWMNMSINVAIKTLRYGYSEQSRLKLKSFIMFMYMTR